MSALKEELRAIEDRVSEELTDLTIRYEIQKISGELNVETALVGDLNGGSPYLAPSVVRLVLTATI